MDLPEIGEADDDALMADAAVGNPAAYAALVRRHQGAIRAYCVRASGSQAIGDDVAQDVFLTLWNARAEYEPRGNFRSYLFTLARNACKNQIRGRARGATLPGELPENPTSTPIRSTRWCEASGGAGCTTVSRDSPGRSAMRSCCGSPQTSNTPKLPAS